MDSQRGHIMVDGTTVYWDEDRDERVTPVVKALKAALAHRGFPDVLLAVQEHEGVLKVQLAPFCRRWGNLCNLVEDLVGKLSDAIICDFWATEFME